MKLLNRLERWCPLSKRVTRYRRGQLKEILNPLIEDFHVRLQDLKIQNGCPHCRLKGLHGLMAECSGIAVTKNALENDPYRATVPNSRDLEDYLLGNKVIAAAQRIVLRREIRKIERNPTVANDVCTLPEPDLTVVE